MVVIGITLVVITAVLATFAGEWNAIFWIQKTQHRGVGS